MHIVSGVSRKFLRDQSLWRLFQICEGRRRGGIPVCSEDLLSSDQWQQSVKCDRELSESVSGGDIARDGGMCSFESSSFLGVLHPVRWSAIICESVRIVADDFAVFDSELFLLGLLLHF